MNPDTTTLKEPIKEPLIEEGISVIDNQESLEKSDFYHWDDSSRIRWTILLFLGSVLVYSARSSMSIAVTAIGNELGWNKQVSGLILSSFFAGYVTTNIIGGYLADKYGGEKVMSYGGLLWSTMTLLVPIAVRYPSYIFLANTYAVVGIRFLTGVGQGMHYPSVSSIISRRNTINDRVLPFSITMSGSAVGSAISGFIGSLLIETLGWPSYFILTGCLSLSWVLLLKGLTDARQEKEAKVISSQDRKLMIPSTYEPTPWCILLTRLEVWALIIASFCSSLCFYNLFSWLPVYFHDKYPESKGWIFNAVPWICAFSCANISGYLASVLLRKRFSVTFVRKLFASICLGGAGLCLMLLNLAENFQQTLFLMSTATGLLSFGNSGILVNPQDLAPRHAGALFGIINTISALSAIIGVYLTGYILETIGDWSAVFQMTSCVCCIGFLSFIFRLWRKNRVMQKRQYL